MARFDFGEVQRLIRQHPTLADAAVLLEVSPQQLSTYLGRTEARRRWWEKEKSRRAKARRAARMKRWRDGNHLRVLRDLLERNPLAWWGLPRRDKEFMQAHGHSPVAADGFLAAAGGSADAVELTTPEQADLAWEFTRQALQVHTEIAVAELDRLRDWRRLLLAVHLHRHA